MALRTDLIFDLGEDWVITLSCNQADGVTPLDLTGAAATLYIGTVAAPLYSAAGALGSPTTAGKVTFHITPAQQAPLTPGSVPYTIRVTLSDTSISDQAYGTLKIRAA